MKNVKLFLAAMTILTALVSCDKNNAPEGPIDETKLIGEWTFSEINLTLEGGDDLQSDMRELYKTLEDLLSTLLIGADHIVLTTPTGDLKSDYVIGEDGKMALDRYFEGVFMSPLEITLKGDKLTLSEDMAYHVNENFELSGSEAFTKFYVEYKLARTGDYDGNYNPNENGDADEEEEDGDKEEPTLEEKVVGQWNCVPIYIYDFVDELLRNDFETNYLLPNISDFSHLRLNSDFTGVIGPDEGRQTSWGIIDDQIYVDAQYGSYTARMEIIHLEPGLSLNVKFQIDMNTFMDALFEFYADNSLDVSDISTDMEIPITICQYTYVGE